MDPPFYRSAARSGTDDLILPCASQSNIQWAIPFWRRCIHRCSHAASPPHLCRREKQRGPIPTLSRTQSEPVKRHPNWIDGEFHRGSESRIACPCSPTSSVYCLEVL